ncbi:amidohydrolase family protein [Bacteroidota bacterium]
MKRLIILFSLITLTLNVNAQNYMVITGATIINTNGDKPIPNATVLIKDSVIIAVGEKIEVPGDAEIINASGKFIIPGLVDAHIHFFQSGGLYTRPDGLDLRHRVPYEGVELKWIRDNIDDLFRRYIRCGITTIIDMGGPFWNFDIIEQSKKAQIAPRSYCSGPLIASYQPAALTTDDPPIIKVNNKEEALELVRKQAKAGTDFIKVWYVVSKNTSSGLMEFYPILEAIVKESHKLGLKVWVHATELETARKSVEAGADVLVHMVNDKEVDDDFIRKVKINNVMIIPTLWVFNSYAAVYSKQLNLMKEEHLLGNPKVIGSLFDMYELNDSELGDRQKKLQKEKKPIKPSEILLYNMKKLQDEGIIIAAGTDAGNVGVIHGPSLFHEFEYMKQAGLTNQEILTDATLNAAKLLDMDSKLGSIEKGKLADLVILNSNPLEQIGNTSDINLVIKNGELFYPDDILKNTPEDLAQIQLNAYNSRDIESFLAVYSKDVEVFEFPNKLLYKGIEKMRERYQPFFASAPDLHCKLVNRIINGNYVIDREYVTGNPRKAEINATAIYEVKNGLIQKVWFIK